MHETPRGMIDGERIRQDRKWGPQNHSDMKWLAILAEEFGEIAKAVVERYAENQQHDPTVFDREITLEIVQTAAVCLAWLEARERRGL
jgi:hypothetical protein